MKRMEAARDLREYDRVPIVPKMNFFYGDAYGINSYDTMTDLRNILPGLKAYLSEFQPDAVWGTAQYSIPVLEALQSNFIYWPGYQHGIGLDQSFQIPAGEYMFEDEMREFCLAPPFYSDQMASAQEQKPERSGEAESPGSHRAGTVFGARPLCGPGGKNRPGSAAGSRRQIRRVAAGQRALF
jgi:hypothetical protein